MLCYGCLQNLFAMLVPSLRGIAETVRQVIFRNSIKPCIITCYGNADRKQAIFFALEDV